MSRRPRLPHPAVARPSLAPIAMRGLMLLLAASFLYKVSTITTADLAPAVTSARPERPPAPAAAVPPTARPPQASYPAITQRPLFFASRKPWQPPRAPAPPPVVPPPPRLTGYTAMGIVESGTARFVLIKPKSGKTLMLTQGEKLDGWALQKIDGDRLHFVIGSSSFDMSLPKPSGRKP